MDMGQLELYCFHTHTRSRAVNRNLVCKIHHHIEVSLGRHLEEVRIDLPYDRLDRNRMVDELRFYLAGKLQGHS